MVELNLIIVAWKFPMQSITSKTGHSYTLMYGADTHIKWEFQAAMGIFRILERTLRDSQIHDSRRIQQLQ